MKKIVLIASILVLSLFAGFASGALSGEETTTAEATTTTAVLTTTSGEIRTYVYSDLDELIELIYQDVYDEIYQEIYEEVSAAIGAQFYEDIYAKVLADLNDVIASGSISVVVNELQERIDAVAVLADASVVGVSTYLGNSGVALGTGVVYRFDAVADEYYLVTNEHVIEGGDNYRIVFADGTYVAGDLLGADAVIDIAVLKFSGADLPDTIAAAPLGVSADVIPGALVLACGHPRGYDFFGSLTMGVIAGVNRDVGGDGVVLYLQHDASINSGNSGGPLYDLEGEVIGINVSKFASTDIEGMGFAIPIDTVKTVIETYDPGF